MLYLAAVWTQSPLQAALLTYSHFRIRILRQAQPAAPTTLAQCKERVGHCETDHFQILQLIQQQLIQQQLIQWQLIQRHAVRRVLIQWVTFIPSLVKAL